MGILTLLRESPKVFAVATAPLKQCLFRLLSVWSTW